MGNTPQPSPLQQHHENEFKRNFITQFLAALEATNYQNNCHKGWKEHKLNVEDAQFLADKAWEEWKETIGFQEQTALKALQERHEYCLEMEINCYRSNEPEIAQHWGIKASECEKAIAIITGQPLTRKNQP